jgi:hypothetical protein
VLPQFGLKLRESQHEACQYSSSWPGLSRPVPGINGGTELRRMAGTGPGHDEMGWGYFSGENDAGTTSMFSCFSSAPGGEPGGQMPLATASARMRPRSAASL